MSKLNAAQRKRLATSQFAMPMERKYPIMDMNHAKNALARVAQNGTPEERAKVRRAVKRKFPSIQVSS